MDPAASTYTVDDTVRDLQAYFAPWTAAVSRTLTALADGASDALLSNPLGCLALATFVFVVFGLVVVMPRVDRRHAAEAQAEREGRERRGRHHPAEVSKHGRGQTNRRG
jgi:hypothetical protein